MSKRMLDPRSTGRRRGRQTLYKQEKLYRCETCGITSVRPPMDAPSNFVLLWPATNRTLESPLQVQHINKDFTDNDGANLKWLCPSCHKLEDLQTDKGVSLIEDEFGYDISSLSALDD